MIIHSSNRIHNLEIKNILKSEKKLNEFKKLYLGSETSKKVLQVIRELSENKELIGKTLENGFHQHGLLIKKKSIKQSKIKCENNFIFIESDYFRELTWIMNTILQIFKDCFITQQACRYLCNQIAKRMLISLKDDDINSVFWDVIDEAETMIKKIKYTKLN